MLKKDFCVLSLISEGRETDIAIFESVVSARAFARKLPGYYSEKLDSYFNPLGVLSNEEADELFERESDGDFVIIEYINPAKLPKYIEVEYNGHIVPLTEFMFDSVEPVEVYYKDFTNLDVLPAEQVRHNADAEGLETGDALGDLSRNLIDGITIVDAYAIENRNVKDYIEMRERKYEKVKSILEKKGFEVARAYRGSEDGEAIIYRRGDSRATKAESAETADCKLQCAGCDGWHMFDHLDPCFVYETPDTDEELNRLVDSAIGILSE